MRALLAASVLAALAGCSSIAGHPRADPQWLVDGVMLSVPAPQALPEGRPFRIAVYGDAHGSREAHRRIVAEIREKKPDLVVYVGDATDCYPAGHLPDFGTVTYAIPFWPQYQRGKPAFGLLSLLPFPALWHETVLRPLGPPRTPEGLNAFLEESWPIRGVDRVPFLFVPGNHDEYHNQDREDVAAFTGCLKDRKLWRVADVGPLRFLVIDGGSEMWGEPDPLEVEGEQEKWLARMLEEGAKAGKTMIACVHFPPFSSAAVEPPSPATRRVAERMLLPKGVPLVLSGHAHAYERLEVLREGGATTFLVTGGGDGRLTGEDESRPEPCSKKFVAQVNHFVWLEVDKTEIRGRMIPVDPAPRYVPGWHEKGEEFVVPIQRP